MIVKNICERLLYFIMNVVDSPLLSDSLQSKLKETLLHGQYPAGTQYSRNTQWVFLQRCNVQDIQGTFREHFKGKDLLKGSRWKSCFCVKSVWFDDINCWSFGKFQLRQLPIKAGGWDAPSHSGILAKSTSKIVLWVFLWKF